MVQAEASAGRLPESCWLLEIAFTSTGRNPEDVREAVAELGPEARPWIADFCDEEAVKEGLAQIVRTEGRLDRVVANVGSGKANPAADVSPGEFRDVFATNFFTTVNLCQLALPHMSGGEIIFISSIAGVESIGAPMPYNAAKTAVLSYMKGLSDRVAARGIRVNAISPGNVLFPGGRWEEKIAADPEGVEAMIREKVPLRTFATPSDIAKGVIFLIQSTMITGHNLIIDGGQVRKFL